MMESDWPVVKIIEAKRRTGRILFLLLFFGQRFLCCSEEPVLMLKEEKTEKDAHYIVRSFLLHFSTASCKLTGRYV